MQSRQWLRLGMRLKKLKGQAMKSITKDALIMSGINGINRKDLIAKQLELISK